MKKPLRFFVLLVAAALLAGCSPAPQAHSRTLLAMDTVMNLTIYADGQDALLDQGEDLLLQLEGLMSPTREDSQIYALNQGETVVLDPQVAGLLDRALELCAWTEGALDLTIYPVVRAWGFTTGSYQVPDRQTLAALLERVDYRQVSVEGDSLTLPEGVQLDLGAVAKGYAGDQLMELFRQGGIDCAQVDLGGNIQVLGNSPDGDPWRVGIRNPAGEGYCAVVEVTDQAVVTSGLYERYFEQDGVRYGHIIDPATGYPVDNGLASVTIVAPSGTLADGLSTALFVMGRDRAVEFWQRSGEFEFILIDEQGNFTISQGLADCFSFAGEQGSYGLEVVRR